MKEIDFIPEWYKANQKRRRSYHRQYVLLALLLAILMGWSFIAGRHVEQACAEVQDVRNVLDTGKMQVNEGVRLETEIAIFAQQTQILEMTRPRTNTSVIIAELSSLVGDNIILSRLSLNNEEIKAAEKDTAVSSAVVQIQTPAQKKTGPEKFLKQTSTRVTLTGIAAQPADAARLISQLEQSDYFEQEALVYSRPKTVREFEVTEFEIRCTVADFKVSRQD